MTLWIIILGMVFVTYSVRLSVIALVGEAAMPETVQRALRYVPPVALSAIIFPELFMPGGSLDISLGNERLSAGLAAVGIAWYSRNTLVTIFAGMILLWVLQSVLP